MRSDRKALTIGVASSFLLVLAMLAASPLLDRFRATLWPDIGPDWYYWKLPVTSPVALGTAWGACILQLLLVWYFLYRLRRDRPTGGTLSRWNLALLWTNLVFAALHIVQTVLWYDGLAADTPVWSSQASVIGMLVLVLILENRRRGLLFGWKAPLPKAGVRVVADLHGYYIALAAVFTFWFHPTETTPGHLFGFLYMFLILLQISLAYTPVHLNPAWTFTLEVLVLFHGTTIAIQQGLENPSRQIWPMFLFGFATVFIVTQVHGLGLSRRTVVAWSVLYAALVVGLYSGLLPTLQRADDRTLADLNEVIRIPAIEYVLTFALAYALWIPGRYLRRLVNRREGAEA